MRIAARRWVLEVRPERGGRITSLRLDGHELLDQGIGVDQPTAEGFVEGGAWGWDEMVPTVEATESLPDHGEAWRVPWSVVSAGEAACAMRAEGRVLPWRLDRTIELGEVVRVSYVLANTGPDAIPGFWSAHPLFRYEAGMEIDVGGARLMSLAEGKSGKFFLPPGEVDQARLRWKSGVGVEIAWDREVAPYCGVWICNGDLGGYRQVAIEPATGGGDRPDSDQPSPQLQPGDTPRWWVELRAAAPPSGRVPALAHVKRP
jgi:galactose mutarotase-like enzyme